MNFYAHRLASTFGYNALEEEERERRSLLILLIGLTGFGGLVYSLSFLSFGVKHTIYAILFYIIFSILNLTYYYNSKNYNAFRNGQLIGILQFLCLTPIANGRYEQNSAVVQPAMLSPLDALMFHKPSAAQKFFFGFIIILLSASLIEVFFNIPRTEIPNQINIGFYFFNLGTTSAICFFPLLKFVRDSDDIKSLLKVKNQELIEKKKRIEDILEELKNTQKQLVQSEKMASLGELTAGIAHDIQNYLNFANNFSEVCMEFLEDLLKEFNLKNYDEVKTIAEELYTNREKINHQDKRADGIVKPKLQPSNSSSCQKVPIDLNALCDEYMRLAYHGSRAKDKSFIATTETNFEPNIPLIEEVPQDIGRVLLNIITNAFHAVSDRRKKESDEYSKVVKVGTGLKDNIATLYVQDNGYAITDQVCEKIFQPFFTTKPTGQGTGLGLSLAFDKVKAHGGDILLDTKVGEGTTSYIQLPLKKTKVNQHEIYQISHSRR